MGQLREFEAAARSFNNFLLSIYAAVYSAAAQDGLQHENEALSELNRALVLAAADGIVMPFVENFDVLEPLLKKQHSKTAVNRSCWQRYWSWVQYIRKI